MSHFGHLFNERFGMRPASAVGLAAVAPVPPHPSAAEPSLAPDLEQLRAGFAALYARYTG